MVQVELNNMHINICANNGSEQKKTLRLPVSYASTPLYAAIAWAEKTSSFFYVICRLSQFTRAESCFRTLVAGFSWRRNVIDPMPVHVGFAVDKVAWRQIFLRALLPFCLRIIPQEFHMQISLISAVRSFVKYVSFYSLSLCRTHELNVVPSPLKN